MVLNEALTPRRRCLFATRMTEGLYTEFCPSASTSSLARQAWSGAHPEISGNVDPEPEVQSEHSHRAPASPSVFLHRGADKNWSVAEKPYARKVIRLPHILSLQEITQRSRDVDDALCDRCTRAEAAHLRVSDVHSRMIVAHILGGMGNRHRDVMLSAKLLTVLREYSPANEFDAPVPCSSFDGVVRIDRMGCSESRCAPGALDGPAILLRQGALSRQRRVFAIDRDCICRRRCYLYFLPRQDSSQDAVSAPARFLRGPCPDSGRRTSLRKSK